MIEGAETSNRFLTSDSISIEAGLVFLYKKSNCNQRPSPVAKIHGAIEIREFKSKLGEKED
jgi:hypothetical protein